MPEHIRQEPKVLVSTENLTEQEWLAYRRRGIGGSDVAAILGISPFRTARDLYDDKLNIASVADDAGNWVALEMGHLLEPLVARIFAKKTGLEVFQIKKMFQHPQYPFMLADVDYFVRLPNGKIAILEIKTTNYNAKDHWWKDGEECVPVYYETQGRHYMTVMDIDEIFYCCLYGNNEDEVIIRHLYRDREYEQEMIYLEREFWHDHILTRIPPPYTEDGSLILESLRRRLGAADKTIPAIQLDNDLSATMLRYLRLQEQKQQVETRVRTLDTEMQRLKGQMVSQKQEQAVRTAFQHGLTIITGSPGTGKTTVLKAIIEVFKNLHPKGKVALMAPTGRASRRMAESTGVDEARTLHSALGLGTGEEVGDGERVRFVDADLVIVDEFSMVDMWLAQQFFKRISQHTRVVLVGDPNQLPSVGAGNVFYELIHSGMVPVTVLDWIFRQSKDGLIAYNAKFINEGSTKLYYGNDFVFVDSPTQIESAKRIQDIYCKEAAERGIENVQILSPFREKGEAASEQLNRAIRERVNPFRSAEEEVKIGNRTFRVHDRIMQTKNTEKVSNGDLGFITGITTSSKGERLVQMDFGGDRKMNYTAEQLAHVDLAYATTIHKAMGSEFETVIIPIVKAHTIMLYRNLLYTAVTRAKKKVILVGHKPILFMAVHRADISKQINNAYYCV